MSTDKQIEQEIQAKGLTAPRVTPADVEANISAEFYFTANDGIEGSRARGQLCAIRRDDRMASTATSLLTFCVLVLKNGFTVTGESACASPENFDAEIGRRIARQNAVAKVWPLMGYELRTRINEGRTTIADRTTQAAAPTDFRDRVRAEAAELDERIQKLYASTEGVLFGALPSDEQVRLIEQLAAMERYSAVLADRIQAFAA